jgi:HEAT repeat protein
VRYLDTEGTEFEILQEALIQDPSPMVRAEAASQISMADEPIALATLVPALQDPDPEVIVAVIEALEFVGEEEAIPHIEPFLLHKNDEVREEAQDAIEFLEP